MRAMSARWHRSVPGVSTAAVPAAKWVEYIPQLDDVTLSRIVIEDGYAVAPDAPGNGIDWDWAVVARRASARRLLRAPGA